MALDANLVNAISNATLDVIKTMANVDVTMKEVVAKNGYTAKGDISAILGITGDSGEGSVSLSFPIQLATLLVSKLLGQGPGMLSSEDRCDGIGELANMISGKAKVALSQTASHPYKLSLPSIIQGAGHEVSGHPRGVPYLLLTFIAENMEFYVQFTFKFS